MARERQRERRARGDPEDGAGVRVDPRGEIERDEGRAGLTEGSHQVGAPALDGAIEARAEDAIDDERRCVERRAEPVEGLEREADGVEGVEVDPSVAGDLVARAREEHPRSMPSREQAPRDDPRVAAVLSRAADDHHALEPVDEALYERVRGAAPRVLHEDEAGHARLDHPSVVGPGPIAGQEGLQVPLLPNERRISARTRPPRSPPGTCRRCRSGR